MKGQCRRLRSTRLRGVILMRETSGIHSGILLEVKNSKDTSTRCVVTRAECWRSLCVCNRDEARQEKARVRRAQIGSYAQKFQEAKVRRNSSMKDELLKDDTT
jgi:hypothetical protein